MAWTQHIPQLSRLSASPVPPAVVRALRHGLVVSGLLFAVYLFAVAARQTQTFGYDAFAYWSVDAASPYAIPHGEFGAFAYSPVIAQLFAPAGAVPWWVFLWLWSGVLLGTAIWLGGRSSALLVLAFPPVALELYYGNVHLLLAAAVVLGFRHPWTWSLVLLTKVSPGVGLLWFAVRREWRSLATAAGATALVVAASAAVAPHLWSEWLAYLTSTASRGNPNGAIPVPLAARLPIAAALVVWGARTDRRWTVPVGAMLALPVLWLTSLAMLAALVPLRTRDGNDRDRTAADVRG